MEKEKKRGEKGGNDVDLECRWKDKKVNLKREKENEPGRRIGWVDGVALRESDEMEGSGVVWFG